MYPTNNTFTGYYGLLAVALYIYPVYYNNTLSAIFSTQCFTFSCLQCNNTSPVNLLSVFFSLIDRTHIILQKPPADPKCHGLTVWL